jgi:hypothetical protein
MRHVKAPAVEPRREEEVRVFCGGGISGCPDWQADMATELLNVPITLVNPRRDQFDVSNKNLSKEQIIWEHSHLNDADAILFWFAQETLCPITLFELGFWLGQKKPLFVGCHPRYSRRDDVIIQSGLVRPEIRVASSVADLARLVTDWVAGKSSGEHQ